MRRKKVRKISKIILIICSLIFFLTFILTRNYFINVNPKIVEVSSFTIDKYLNSFLSNNIGYEIFKDTNLDNIINIEQNKDGEILYVTYNLENAYLVLDKLTKELNTLITDLENGNIKTNNKNIESINGFLVVEEPLFISSNWAFLTSLGPKVYLPVNFSNILLTNIKTKVTNYGMNNALIEVYVTIDITTKLFSPVSEKRNEIYYDALISSTIINGRVPSIYTSGSDESNIFSIPIN
jgi:sporulation protein YunB